MKTGNIHMDMIQSRQKVKAIFENIAIIEGIRENEEKVKYQAFVFVFTG